MDMTKSIRKYLLPAIIIIGIICVIIFPISETISSKVTLIALIGTALIYSFQLISMNNQKDIADKQHKFNIFTLRMNLRNELQRVSNLVLSANDRDITDPVNIKLVNLEKITSDIKLAFPKNKKLNSLIIEFMDSCKKITKLAEDKEIIIECGEKRKVNDGYTVKYADMFGIWTDGIDKFNYPPFSRNTGMSKKQYEIIVKIVCAYINMFPTKKELERYIIEIFGSEMYRGHSLLKEILVILDKDISL